MLHTKFRGNQSTDSEKEDFSKVSFKGGCWNVYSQNVYSNNVYSQNVYFHNVYCAKMSIPTMFTMSKCLLLYCPFLPQDKNKKR